MRRLFFLIFALFLVCGRPAAAVEPDEILDDPVLEQRARDISAQLRCVVCQNQSIDSSDAPLAKDLRILVRERLVAGDTDEEVLAFITQRYGDFVLLKPPFKPETYLLWFGPLLFLIVGAGIAIVYLQKQRTTTTTAAEQPLTPEEQERLKRLMEDKPQ